MTATGVRLRPAEATDRALLLALYAADRSAAYAALCLHEQQLMALLESQMRARDAAYARRFPCAEQWVVVSEECSVGQVLLYRTVDALRVLEFAILPERRRCGYGAAAVRDVQRMAGQSGREVTLRVRARSDALRLYQQLGFAVVGDEGSHLQMRWDRTAGQQQAGGA